MKRRLPALLVTSLFLLLQSSAKPAARAQTSAGFNLEWNVIASGGQASSSLSYQVDGTVGQSLASPPTSGSASFAVSSGYWSAGTGAALYLPAILDN